MQDQAEKLRLLARSQQQQGQFESPSLAAEVGANPSRKTRVIAVTSGKGGVGKTNFTINLALALVEKGQQVLVLDADLGLANIDVVLGITPQYNLYHVVNGDISLKEAITYSPQGVMVLAGGSGVDELANLPKEQTQQFIEQLEELEGLADILLIDTGAGLNKNVMSFVMTADEVVLICTPEPTAITDAYGLVKSLCSVKPQSVVRLVVNRAETEKEAEITANKLTTVADKFLGFAIKPLGHILDDAVVSKAVKGQEPFVQKFPNSAAAQCIRQLAGRILHEEEKAKLSGGMKSFFKKMVSFFD